jgi:hypothetical protein
MFLPPESLVHALKPWAEYYGNSHVAPTIVTFLHVGALVLAGGFAVSTDRDTLRVVRQGEDARTQHLEDMDGIHPWVVGGLVVAVLSGLLLFGADVRTFYGSWVFWTKMVLIVLLLANGSLTVHTERAMRGDGAHTISRWRTLHTTAIVSVVLWFTIALAGMVLVNL